MSKPQGRLSALALAAAVVMGFGTSDARALALGRVTVQSALGETLRADIDIPEINAEELGSLKAAVASPEAFRAAGLEYNPALAGVKITLQRRPSGGHFLRLSSDRPVNEPFVDLILEAKWTSGRIVRDYTMLFDPPILRQPAAPMAAQVSPAPAQQAAAAPQQPAESPASASATAPNAAQAAESAPPPPAESAPVATPAMDTATASTAESKPAAESSAVAPSPQSEVTAEAKPAANEAPTARPLPAIDQSEAKRITVKSGDTAARIATAHKSPSVSLDQMLIALLRGNSDAFVRGNVNRLKAGAVLEVPTTEQAGLVPPDEAKKLIVAQSRDFNEFRRRLAEGVAATEVESTNRRASGKVQAQVEDKKPQGSTSDKLTLSKAAVPSKAGEDKIAREREAQEAASRVAELNKNLADLNRLNGGAASAAPAATASSAPRTGIAAPAAVAATATDRTLPAAATAPAPASVPAVAAASAPAKAGSAAVAAAPAAAASGTPQAAPQTAKEVAPAAAASAAAAPAAAAPVAPKPKKKAAPPPPPPPETSFLDDAMENPLIPAVGVGALAVLLGFGFYKVRQRRKATQVDSSFLESRLQPDSFFGASGGQRVDTAESGSPTGSSMVYSPSQLDAAGDVDPVAEADVYLAYGRDLQAEEILKEALRTSPQRVAIHAKLLEIYAKRRDAKAFEVIATEAYNLTHGAGSEWEHICSLGQDVDPSNGLYRPGGRPGAPAAAHATAASAAATQPLPAASAAAAPDLDLDLDFSLGDEPSPAKPAVEAKAHVAAAHAPAAAAPTLEMDFGVASAAVNASLNQTESSQLDAPALTLNENSLSFSLEPAASTTAPAPAPAAAKADSGMIEFDLGSLSLDIGSAPGAAASQPAAAIPATAPAMELAADVPLSLDTDEPMGDVPLITPDLTGDGEDDPLATKLALAEEFNAIGDADGARSLAQEVLAEAAGDLKSRAQRLLAEIG